MPTLAIISDTHIPERAERIPPAFVDRIEGADHVIHAGDFTSQSALNTVQELADGALTAVSGNMDRSLGLPLLDTLAIGDVTFVVTHGTGDPVDYERRVAGHVREEAGDSAVGVAGHTHEPLDTIVDGVRLLNPGSVTGADPADRPTMLTATVADGDVAVEHHAL